MVLQVGNSTVAAGMQWAAGQLENVSFIPQSTDPASPNYLMTFQRAGEDFTGNKHYNYEGQKRIGELFARSTWLPMPQHPPCRRLIQSNLLPVKAMHPASWSGSRAGRATAAYSL